jgi:hypothetical protein
LSDVPDDFMMNVDEVIEEDKPFLKAVGSGSLFVIPRCPNCGSVELVGGEGYLFCTICGWDELDGKEQ